MKAIFVLFVLTFSFLRLNAAEELLIPAELNALVPKIRAGMTIGEVEALLSPIYPKVTSKVGLWPDQTGFIDYQLNDQLLLSVSSTGRRGKERVDENILCYIVNRGQKHRLDIKSEYRSVQGRSGPGLGELLMPSEMNALIPKIRGSMTTHEVEALLSAAYPEVKGDMGAWSGQTGSMEYRFKDQLVLSVSSYNRGGMTFVGDDLLFSISDRARQHSVEIKSDYWVIPGRK